MNRQSILKQLEEFVSIQSVSTDPARFSQIQKAVKFLKRKFIELGFQVKIVKKANYPPLILAIYPVRKPNHSNGVYRLSNDRRQNGKTIGIYGHYDVQPEDPLDQWQTPPFKLTVRGGKLYGRGVADNKGHIIQNLVSINQLIKTKKLKNNIVFILEGEEEIGSVHFEEYIKKVYPDLIGVDVFYLTDMGMANKTTPQIFYGLRGILYFELTVKIGEHDVHSGNGNRILNPAQLLADIMIKIKSVDSNKIKIPHFCDDCRKISKKEKNLLKQTVENVDNLAKNMAVYRIVEFDNIHPSLASKIYPSFDINGFSSGYQGFGMKTIIPASATVKFSFRLVEYQDPDKIEKLAAKFIRRNMPDGVKYELKTFGKAAPFYSDLNNKYVKKTTAILEKIFGHKTLFNRSGGSVPAAEVLQRLFKKPIILTGFTLPDSNIHAPNENFDEEVFFLGIEALEKIYDVGC
jgi:acetylornithine deacetylase/succinyl-diaminopimelate desuccinylase-like protein